MPELNRKKILDIEEILEGIKQLKEQYKTLAEGNSELETEKEKNKALIEEIETLKVMYADYDSIAAKNEYLEKKLAELGGADNSQEDVVKAKKIKKYEILVAKNNQLIKEVAELKSKYDAYDHLAKNKKLLEENITDLEAKLDSLQAQYNELEEKYNAKELEGLLTNSRKLELEETNKELSDVIASLNEKYKDYEEMAIDVTDLEAQLTDLQSRYDKLAENNKQLAEQVESLNIKSDGYDDMVAKANDYAKKIAELQTELYQKNQTGDLEDKLAEAYRIIDDMTEQKRKTEQKINELEAQLTREKGKTVSGKWRYAKAELPKEDGVYIVMRAIRENGKNSIAYPVTVRYNNGRFYPLNKDGYIRDLTGLFWANIEVPRPIEIRPQVQKRSPQDTVRNYRGTRQDHEDLLARQLRNILNETLRGTGFGGFEL